MKFAVNDCVRLIAPELLDGIDVDDIGVVVFAFSEPREAYEVEFCDADGRVTTLRTILPERLVGVWGNGSGAEFKSKEDE